MTRGELVSRITNDIRALNKDQHISKRYILSIAENKARFLLAQKLRDRTLYREDNLYSTIKCFALEKDDIVKCDVIQFRRCKSIRKSVLKLPEMIYSRYGNSILSVTTIDGENSFDPITGEKYRKLKDRLYGDEVAGDYYTVSENHLIIPDSKIEAVNVELLTLELDKVDEVSGCSDCDLCQSMWDYEFVCSDKLLESVITGTLQEVISTYKQISVDENPNLDEHQKSKTII